MFGYLIFDLVLFCVLVYFIGGRSSGFEIGHVFLVLAGIAAGSAVALYFLYPVIGHYGWLVIAPFVVLALARYLYVSAARAILIVLVFLVVEGALLILG